MAAKVSIGVKKVLKPDVFQEFELKEKTIISHNVAMSVVLRIQFPRGILTATATVSNFHL